MFTLNESDGTFRWVLKLDVLVLQSGDNNERIVGSEFQQVAFWGTSRHEEDILTSLNLQKSSIVAVDVLVSLPPVY